ncbi:MAG: flagellar biosynthetic protein FlhB [Schlesneria sp.]|nr:flagellar biosynthetic protein FlhB [Schlesneria sp.]
MSADDTGERTQRPTERRRREARARGEVARSTDFVSAFVLLFASLGVWWFGPGLGSELSGMMRSTLSSQPPTSINEQIVVETFLQLATRLGIVLLPILFMIAAAAAAASLVQTGFLWVPTAVLPQLERLDLARGLGRWWSMSTWFGLFLSMIKLAILFGVLMTYTRMRLISADPLVTGSPSVIYSISTMLIGELAVVLSLSLVVVAIADYGYQFWQAERRLMMTVEEVRREQREDETNPRLKRRRRELAVAEASRQLDGPPPI